MKISLNWLRRYIDLDWDVEELTRRLTMAGIEVEGVEEIRAQFNGVITAYVREVKQHPGADKLHLAKVDTGSEILDIVCGAPNCREGLTVALAPIGATVGEMKIKKAKLRGEPSFGMLCSEFELGLSSSHDGILELEPGLPLGRPLTEVLPIEDTVLELSLTANRGDCLSHLGVAREIAALSGKTLKYPELSLDLSHEGEAISVQIDAPDRCARYVGRTIHDVKVGPSPFWMRRLLEAVGVRSINNLVDVTNFVLFEYGQPLHAFDLRHVRGGRIQVRTAHEGEKMATLDGVERSFCASDLLICDGVGPVAVAGVMGGLDSEVKADTTDILLESAWFQPSSVRLTARRLGLHSESSHRFERDIDVDMTLDASARAMHLFCELSAPGSKPWVSALLTDAHPRKVERPSILFKPCETTRRLGVEIPEEEQRNALNSLGFKVSDEGGGWRVAVPGWRGDVHEGADLIEEIARFVGYDRIPTAVPRVTTHAKTDEELRAQKLRNLRSFLSHRGVHQALNYSFLSEELQHHFVAEPGLQVVNPLGEEQRVLRQMLLPRLCLNVAHNQRHGIRDLCLFEIGRVFFPRQPGEQPEEREHLGLIWTAFAPHHWSAKERELDFFDIKGLIEDLAAVMRCPVTRVEAVERSWLHPGAAAQLFVGDRVLGVVGELHPQLLNALEMSGPVLVAELELDVLTGESTSSIRFEEFGRFPSVTRDLALRLKKSISAAQVLAAVQDLGLDIIDNCEIFDEYCGCSLAPDERSLGLSVTYRASDRTLTDNEVGQAHGRLVQHLEAQFDAKQR